jgi:radical SAM superfamily enzyme YgiQ (UPF0313 family)
MGTWHERSRAQAVLSRETGSVRKPHADRLRVALAFPNTYYVGMSNLGFQTAYRLFNDLDAVVCERVFLPRRDERDGGARARAPLVTLESQTPVRDVDVLAFSVSFEWDYANVPMLLRRAGVPVFASERGARHPLVVIGGAVTFLNPEPLAPFADIVACGEGEVLIPALADAVAGAGGRREVLERLAARPGFYIPSFYDVAGSDEAAGFAGHTPRAGTPAVAPVRKAVLRNTAGVDPPSTAVFTPDTEFGSRLLIEVVRGCANLCRFCWAGYNYLPVRPFAAARILDRARAARPHASRAGLVSIALCDHPEIQEILGGLRALGYSLSPASLRIDDLTAPVVRALAESGERTMTIAPEAGSDRLRRVVNKTVTNREILERADMLFGCGIENLKLYYMVGVPTETDEDLVAIRDLTRQLREVMMRHARRRGRPGQISASVNPMVPKPGTAYQWLPMEQPSTIERKGRRLRALVAGLDNVSFSIKSEKQFYYQALLSLGDRALAPAIAALEQHRGDWRAALRSCGVDPARYVLRDRAGDAALPWDIIAGGPPAAFLRDECQKSLRAESSGARRPNEAEPERRAPPAGPEAAAEQAR